VTVSPAGGAAAASVRVPSSRGGGPRAGAAPLERGRHSAARLGTATRGPDRVPGAEPVPVTGPVTEPFRAVVSRGSADARPVPTPRPDAEDPLP
jgi:hypothetical protein